MNIGELSVILTCDIFLIFKFLSNAGFTSEESFSKEIREEVLYLLVSGSKSYDFSCFHCYGTKFLVSLLIFILVKTGPFSYTVSPYWVF